MFPEFIVEFFAQHQNSLWVATVGIDLGLTLLLYRLYGKQGLYAVIVLNIMLSNLQGPKLTTVFGMQTSLGMIIYSGIYFATDILSERYGKREANRAVMIGFFTSIILIAMISISLLFLPTQDPGKKEMAESVHEAIGTLFGYGPRFVFGSLFAYLISQRLDVFTFHYLKKKTNGRMLWLRNNLSTMSSQLVDTVIYSTVVWWGFFDFKTAVQLAFAKYIFKVTIAALDTPFIYWARTWKVHDKDWSDAAETTVESRD
ncbi:MAG: queuosine precursor transporter [Candidatus Hydrogenedentota bacterium]